MQSLSKEARNSQKQLDMGTQLTERGEGSSAINKLECSPKIATLCFKLVGCLSEMTIL